LEAIKENIEFGKEATDYLKTLPTMVVSGVGSITIADLLLKVFDIKLLIIYGLIFAAIGFIGYLVYIRLIRNFKIKLYIAQDYERTLYYEQYVNRVMMVLNNLYNELDQIHQHVYGFSYSQVFYSDENDNIEMFLSGIRPTFCEFTHEHMSKRKIKPGRWAGCEVGIEEVELECPALKSRMERLKIFFSSLF